jgi:hypothetical protein
MKGVCLLLCLLEVAARAAFCEAFSPGYVPFSISVKMLVQKTSTESQIWVPKLPKKFDLSQGAILTEAGITKDAFEAFFAKQETSSYAGYKWEMVDNKVYIYDMADTPHERASGAFNLVFIEESIQGGRVDDIIPLQSAALTNPDPNMSDWQPDSSILPSLRAGPLGSHDKLLRYPTLVLEVASSEDDGHVISKAKSYLGPNTSVQIVLVLLLRPKKKGADRLEVRKFERGQPLTNPWSCSFGDPVCIRAGDPAFQLQLSVDLLFDNAPLPTALVGGSHVELDLFRWKQVYLRP